MADAKQLPSGRWRALVFDGIEQGKRKYKSFTADTRKEANYLAAQYALTKKEIKHTEMTFLEAREKYLELKKNVLSESTIRGYHQMRTYFGIIDDLKLEKITSLVIQKWINDFSATHATKTVKNAYGFVHIVLSTYQPDLQLNVTLPQKEVKELFVPSDDYVTTVLQYFRDKQDTDMEIAILLAAYGPMRRSEICGLKSCDIKDNVVHVKDSKVVNKDGKIVEKKKVKNSSSDRYIEFPTFVIKQLPKDGNIINITPNVITKRYGRAIKDLKLEHSTFHDLRHYAASVMHAIGVPDQYIMARGGWNSDVVLKRIYRGTIADYNQRFVKQTNQHFEKMQKKQ